MRSRTCLVKQSDFIDYRLPRALRVLSHMNMLKYVATWLTLVESAKCKVFGMANNNDINDNINDIYVTTTHGSCTLIGRIFAR